ncbi:MAG TPA: NAD(P)H-quinone oxidoreductase [Parvularculaceae bacterium]|nr:NAD(P)H-quinone oxidoreductase [Caulobacterales bacterium]HPE32067.1 NAD(P)H-quinone oxidoreductase [Parvularculaceae bacterium]HRX38698.1 NAD(P)H-quinone oxidoreductase [Parvularculaceae bacterium]
MTDPIPPMMRCIEIEQPGGPEVLRLAERPTPSPGEGEVLIKVAAAGVNRPDLLQRRGLYPPPPGASDLPGLEVSGVVAAVGPNVTKVKPGDSVCALLTGGGYAEYAVAHEGSCLPVPAGLSMEAAAGLPETYFTVWANIFDDAGLGNSETLLIHGGTSGIGVTAIALAKAVGAKVIATASSEDKLKAILNLGADAALNYTSDDWEKKVVTEGGADVVLDMTGGDFVARNISCLNPFGRHVSIATLRGFTAEINIFDIMRKRLTLSGSTMKTRPFEEKAELAEALEAHVWPLLASGEIKPVMDQTFPLAEASKAHERMEKGGHIGKIVLSVSKG